jgi:hypothetical protein
MKTSLSKLGLISVVFSSLLSSLYGATTQVIQTQVSGPSLIKQLAQRSTLNYYQQFLGPTIAGKGGQSYNVFQEARTPYQSFHAMNLTYRFNSDWAMGGSIAVVNAYGETTSGQQNRLPGKMLRDEFFNARALLYVPTLKMGIGNLYTTLAYEAPTSVVARQTQMQHGAVLIQSFAFNLPSLRWSSGLIWQYYRAFYEENVATRPADFYFPGSLPERVARQTTIVSGGPYLSYRISDRWGLSSSVTFDWDQRGLQTDTQNFNNNLPDRARLGVSYFPGQLKQLSNVGLFTQGLLKYTPDTQVLGAEFALRF